jgi:hypothetical protein
MSAIYSKQKTYFAADAPQYFPIYSNTFQQQQQRVVVVAILVGEIHEAAARKAASVTSE